MFGQSNRALLIDAICGIKIESLDVAMIAETSGLAENQAWRRQALSNLEEGTLRELWTALHTYAERSKTPHVAPS